MMSRTAVLLLLALASAASMAQVGVSDPIPAGPSRGERMVSVERKLGAPTTRHEPVGRPPITRWDYPGFSVYFESDRVIHTVRRP